MSKKKKLKKESYEQELYLEELSNEKLKLELSLKDTEPTKKLGQQVLLNTTKELVEGIIEDLRVVGLKDNKAVFLKAFGHYNKAQQVNFVMDNVLEGLKKGENLNKIVKTYENIGLVEASLASDINEQEKADKEGGFMKDVILKGLKKIGAILIKIMLKALKNLGSPVKLVIGINGLSIPSVQFIIDKKVDITALSGKDIIEVIQKNA